MGIEEESRKRDEIMAAGNAERVEKDKQRRLEIGRQEQLLSGRSQRAKTEEHGDPSEDEPWRAAQRLQQRVKQRKFQQRQRKLQQVQQRDEQREFQRVRCAEYKWGGNRVL